MISSLLTALGVAALSIQTPSNIQPQEPKRAYYDSSAVAEYGTNTRTIYNYSSAVLSYYDQNAGTTATFAENESGPFTSYNHNGQSGYTSLTISANTFTSIDELKNALDVYLNGSLLSVGDGYLVTPSTYSGGKYKYYYAVKTDTTTNPYIWVFDHEVPNMSETIAEVVGDATTAAGAVLGSGISGAIALFYNEGITGLGIIALILTGVSLVWFAFSLILRLWRRS